MMTAAVVVYDAVDLFPFSVGLRFERDDGFSIIFIIRGC